MKIEILKKILQLDSLIGFLDWTDRVEIHQFKEKSNSPRIVAAYEWILKENWEVPQMRYGQDRLLYYYDSNSEKKILAEYYLKNHPQYKQELTKLKYL